MKIQDIKVLRGPNRWSVNRTQLIQVRLDIGEYEMLPSNKVEGFTKKLFQLLPTLYCHRCSLGREGGFLQRMDEGTWMGHIVEHIALELQCLAHMECGFGRTRSTGKYGEYNVVFSYVSTSAGIFAAESAVDLAHCLAQGLSFDLKRCLGELSRIGQEERLGPSTQAIVDAAAARGIPWTRLDGSSLVMLGQGAFQRRIRATLTDRTGNIAVETVQDKHLAKQMLRENYLPVPDGTVISDISELEGAIDLVGYPLAIKPLDGNHGRGVSSHVVDLAAARRAFEKAIGLSSGVIVEKHVRGDDYRLLVVGYELVAASRRTPAHVVGDGMSTVSQLIDRLNSDPRRGHGHERTLTRIEVDHQTLGILDDTGIGLDSVLPAGTRLLLKHTANLSTGGTSEDVTDLVPQSTRAMAERAARVMGLDICGIDLVARDIGQAIGGGNGAILEINAAPGFRMHTHPSKGAPRDVGKKVVGMLFPEGAASRIPIVAVTGTNGKTSTVRILSHIAQVSGKKVGCTTTEGIYLNGECIAAGDCSGPASAGLVLSDPMVDFAVLECARGGIIRAGLGFDLCDVSIITNIAQDHLGLDGIDDLDTLARIKGTVAEATKAGGMTVLNAEDDMARGLAAGIKSNVGYFALDGTSGVIKDHFSGGGAVAYVHQGWLTLGWKGKLEQIVRVCSIPVTMGGKYDCMVQNCLAAALAARSSGISVREIREGLRTFLPDPEMNLGRMNSFEMGSNRIFVDYAHNAHGYIELGKFLSRIPAHKKTGLITATGDRRDEDIIEIGYICAGIFDRLILRTDRDCRGRDPQEIIVLLLQGINRQAVGHPVVVVPLEADAVKCAMDSLAQDELLFISSDDSRHTLALVQDELDVRKSKHEKYGT